MAFLKPLIIAAFGVAIVSTLVYLSPTIRKKLEDAHLIPAKQPGNNPANPGQRSANQPNGSGTTGENDQNAKIAPMTGDQHFTGTNNSANKQTPGTFSGKRHQGEKFSNNGVPDGGSPNNDSNEERSGGGRSGRYGTYPILEKGNQEIPYHEGRSRGIPYTQSLSGSRPPKGFREKSGKEILGHSKEVAGGAAQGSVQTEAPVPPKSQKQLDLEWIDEAPNPSVSIAETIRSVERYHKALQQLKNGNRERSVEMVFHMGMRAARDLMYVISHMESETYERVEKKMEGFVLDREGVFEVYPKYSYFSDLATAKGSSADFQFFEISKAHITNGLPNYQRRITEFSTCTKYGNGLIVDAYTSWTTYKRTHPHLYTPEVDKGIDEATSELTTNNCLCEDEKSLYKEYSLFLKSFPDQKLAGELRSRMQKIKEGNEDVRPNCKANNADGRSPASTLDF